MPMHMSLDGRDHALDVAARRPGLRLSVDGVVHEVLDTATAGPGRFALEVDGRPVRGWVHVAGDDVFLRLDGRCHRLTVDDGRGGDAAAGAAADEVRAEMPGMVVAVHCAAGDTVDRGAPLVTIESMKLQTTLAAPRDGVVAEVHLGADAAFSRGDLLVSLQPVDAAGDAAPLRKMVP